ncbi:alpha/beta hydrolase [Caulobacter segnis]|uniref:Esterase n=1 Tax=Caulobacter segnis TaxID=88688 RepID=A0A2W5V9Q9_9CAUL|nr:alpha/beta hydrolase-fold protein [Caulobacter segnis]PZR33346.1 MAG: esterase [Caulobacter segnis]
MPKSKPGQPQGASEGWIRLTAPSGRGQLYVLRDFVSRHLAARDLYVWRPDGADEGAPLPVLYMQDGQNLFDARLVPFGAAWEADASLSRLIDAGQVAPTLIVGVACTRDRFAEYAPALLFDHLSDPARQAVLEAWPGAPKSAAYARMLVEEIKPLIDASFATRPGRESTFVAGSSMGAVAASELLARHPHVFAGAAMLSAHFSLLPVTETERLPEGFSSDVAEAVSLFAQRHMPRAGSHRLWLDRGTLSIDRFYPPAHAALVRALLALGYVEGVDLSVRTFAGASHDEGAWRERLDQALAFLLSPRT